MNTLRFNEAFKLEPERLQRMERLCLRAVADGAISEPKPAELLRVRVRELGKRLMAQFACDRNDHLGLRHFCSHRPRPR
jgi:hypothetical protein